MRDFNSGSLAYDDTHQSHDSGIGEAASPLSPEFPVYGMSPEANSLANTIRDVLVWKWKRPASVEGCRHLLSE